MVTTLYPEPDGTLWAGTRNGGLNRVSRLTNGVSRLTNGVSRFTIKPHFLQTWWFRVLAVLSFLFLIRLFYLFKMKNIKTRQRLLEQQVAERTRSLKNKTVELEEKSTTLEKIDRFVKAINTNVDPKNILTTILSETAVLEGIERAVALVYDLSIDSYTVKASLGYDMEHMAYIRFSPREAEERYTKGAGEIHNDIFIIRDVKGRTGEEKLKPGDIPKSILVLRIRSGDIENENEPPAGYLVFDSMESEKVFETPSIDMLKELKDHIAAAFIKSKLLLELEAEREAAEVASHAKSMFLARMSHEIRTPMNSVIGFADMMMDTELNGEQKEFIQNITKSGEALLHLIDEILDFSRIELGRLSFQPVDFDLNEIVSDVCRLVVPRVGEKPIDITCRIGDGIPPLVKGDPGRIRQVLINLMGNAVKFTDTGTIELSIALEEETENQLKVHMAVRDTGIGIAADQLENIFEIFQQADGSITRKYGGTGLGLAISKQIALLMGGDILVESQLGKGSTFHFTTWLENPEKESIPFESFVTPGDKDEHISADRHPVYILPAEDNPINRKLARFILTKAGCQLEEADNGKEAVELFTSNPGKFDLIFMDVNMPEMDGLEATRVIRSKGFVEVPIIALTAHAMKEDREECLAAGMNDYMTKPIKRDIIFEMIKKWSLWHREPISTARGAD